MKKNVKDSFTKAEFKELCPSLIHQIDANACHSHASGDHDHFHGDGQHDHHDHDHHELEIEQSKIGFANVPAKGDYFVLSLMKLVLYILLRLCWEFSLLLILA